MWLNLMGLSSQQNQVESYFLREGSLMDWKEVKEDTSPSTSPTATPAAVKLAEFHPRIPCGRLEFTGSHSEGTLGDI